MERDVLLQKAFGRGVLCGMLVIIAADGVHWRITSTSHPEAGSLRTALVVAQVVLCTAGGAWLYLRPQALQPG